VIGVGANSVDRVVILPGAIHILGASGKMPLVTRSLMCGGETATLLCACASFGLKSAYVGVVGADSEGETIRTALSSRGVDVRQLREHPTTTRGSVILVNRDTGDRIVLSDRNQALNFRPGEISLSQISSTRVVHVDDADQDAGIGVAAFAAGAGIPVTSDIDKISDRTESLVAAVTYPIFDSHAPVVLTGEADPERALRKLRRLNAGLLCMTLGASGAAALDGDRFVLSPGFDVNPVDTTGAGDVFRAGFVFGLLRAWPLVDQLRFANAAAALSCTRLGAIASVPTLDEVQQLQRGER